MAFPNRTVTLDVVRLEDRTLPAILPLSEFTSLIHDAFPTTGLAAESDCDSGEVADGPKRCAPELPEDELIALQTFARAAVDLVLRAGWGQSVRDIYRAFLDGPFDLHKYGDGSEVVEGSAQAIGFRHSPVTVQVTQLLHGALRNALEDLLTEPPPKGIDCGSLPANEEFAIPIRRTAMDGLLTSAQLRPFELALEYETVTEIPGIMAGGISDSMGAGMDDRSLDGFLVVTRQTVDGQTVALDLRTDLTISVYDSIDFCPGALGDWVAQILTRPLQLLQANYWAQAVPFLVTFAADPAETTLAGDELPASCQGSNPGRGGGPAVDTGAVSALARSTSIPVIPFSEEPKATRASAEPPRVETVRLPKTSSVLPATASGKTLAISPVAPFERTPSSPPMKNSADIPQLA